MSYAIDNLNNLPFSVILGGPLKSVVEAQQMAAMSTIDFIQTVGLTKKEDDDNILLDDPTKDAAASDVRNVTFRYKKEADDPSGTNPAFETVELSVPILTIVPIPFIRIASTNIDFGIKISEVIRTSTVSRVDTRLGVTAKLKFGKKFSLSGSYTRAARTITSNSSNLSTHADLDIKLHAVQDDMPTGLARVLTILEKAITEKTVNVNG
ncbi:MAG TPA: hypothetical protein DCS93_42025 [Microscillaceae bacterium]|nr:hypothetical protein [Microscillaceae bacterium]